MSRQYTDRLTERIRETGTPAVVGIDPVLERLPAELRLERPTAAKAAHVLRTFGQTVIDAVAPVVPAVKINSAFFEVCRAPGVAAYYELVAYAHERGLLVIGDVKRGDIGSTAKLYARAHIADAAFADEDPAAIPDAVTVAGYLGESAVRAFAEAAAPAGRGLYVLVRPSDPGADEIHDFGAEPRFYQHMAGLVRSWGARPDFIGECGLSCVGAVVAPKDAASTAALRAALPTTPFLVPGYGAQGADASTCRPCFLPNGTGALINASRSVIFAFERESYQRACGAENWRECIAAAARDFAKDVAAVVA